MTDRKIDPSTAFPSYPLESPYPRQTNYPTYPHYPPFDHAPPKPFPVRPALAYPPHFPPYTTWGLNATYKKGPECGMPPSYNEVTGETGFHASHPPMSTYRPPPQSAYWGPIEQPIHLGAIYDPGARFNETSRPGIPPPPPGIAPNQAQIAAMQGRTIIASKKKSGFWDGSSGGFI